MKKTNLMIAALAALAIASVAPGEAHAQFQDGTCVRLAPNVAEIVDLVRSPSATPDSLAFDLRMAQAGGWDGYLLYVEATIQNHPAESKADIVTGYMVVCEAAPR